MVQVLRIAPSGKERTSDNLRCLFRQHAGNRHRPPPVGVVQLMSDNFIDGLTAYA